jgi:hypothetical protein
MTKLVCRLWSRLPWFSSETPGFSPFILTNEYRLGDRLCQALGSVEHPRQQIRSSEYAYKGTNAYTEDKLFHTVSKEGELRRSLLTP